MPFVSESDVKNQITHGLAFRNGVYIYLSVGELRAAKIEIN